MKKFYGPGKAYKTEKEWEQAFEGQAKTTAETLKITLDQARVRLLALFASGILEQGSPEDPAMQMMIDYFLTNPKWDNQPKGFGVNQ